MPEDTAQKMFEVVQTQWHKTRLTGPFLLSQHTMDELSNLFLSVDIAARQNVFGEFIDKITEYGIPLKSKDFK